MLDYLIKSVISLGHWGYLVIFLVVVLECQALLGLVMPGESLVLIGGFLSGSGGIRSGFPYHCHIQRRYSRRQHRL